MEDADHESALRQVAAASTRLLQDSKGELSHFEDLLGFANDQSLQVAKSAVLSLAAVFSDVLPSYNLRSMDTSASGQRVSHVVQKVLDAERTLLGYYKRYLAILDAHSRKGPILKRACMTARCLLMQKAATPAMLSKLLQAVVPCLAGPEADLAIMCSTAISQAMRDDKEGALTQEAVQLIADLVKVKGCQCMPSAVTTLQDVNIQFFGNVENGSHAEKSGKEKSRKFKHRRKGVNPKYSQMKSKARVSHIAEAIFETYFRVLKHAASSRSAQEGEIMEEGKALRLFPLLMPTMEGLLKHAQLMGVEYHEDALKVLLRVANAMGLPIRMRVVCLCVAATAYQSRGELVTTDRSSLFTCMQDLLPLCSLGPIHSASDSASSAKSGMLTEMPEQIAGIDTHTASLLSFLTKRMLTGVGHNVELGLLLSTAKRLVAVALQMEYGSSKIVLEACQQALRQNKRLLALCLERSSRQGIAMQFGGFSEKQWSTLLEEDQAPMWIVRIFADHACKDCADLGLSVLSSS